MTAAAWQGDHVSASVSRRLDNASDDYTSDDYASDDHISDDSHQ
jgi:hypothetical protein